MSNPEQTPAFAYPEPKDAQPSEMTADRVARLVTELGVGWAKYGLTLGRLALRQSAKALETTSELLGVVADRVEKIAVSPAATPAATPEGTPAGSDAEPETQAETPVAKS